MKDEQNRKQKVSAFQPGNDGNCIAIVYIRETAPMWVMVPCDQRLATDLICKNQPRVHNPLQRPVYPSLRCQERWLLIDDTCYECKPVYNDSMSCVGDTSYLSYLNKNFGNRGINVIFTTDCTVVTRYETRVQHGMMINNYSISYMSADVKVFQIEETYTKSSICGSTTQQCDDGSCRAQSIVCTLDFECAPNICACMVNDQLNYNKDYCRHQCPLGTCTCAPLMFQCSTGGCIPYVYVCDNVNNCADSSDEFCAVHTLKEYQIRNIPTVSTQPFQSCFGFICSDGLCIYDRFVNDLIPDCSDAGDEYHSISIKYTGSHFHCNDVHEIPCTPGHSKCFGIHNLCVYDRDSFGHISYCRDGAHLLDCLFVQCTNTFKCPRSYCIPLRKVCDGVHDCMDGEDEVNCQNNLCPGYLKCSGFECCIHPTEVCDGYSHCPHGDDETFCENRDCPVGCTCLWHGLMCRDTRLGYMPQVPFQDMVYLSVWLNEEFDITFANLSSLSKLIILDLSSANITNICPAFQVNYAFYISLYALYLQMNDIEYISPLCFSKLSSLLVLDLQGNHLIHIANDAFKGTSLNVLILKDSAILSSLSGHWIDGFHRLEYLDIRGVKLNYWSQNVLNGLRKIETIHTDDTRLCCILHNIKGCRDPKKKHVKCFRLLSKSYSGPLLSIPAFINLILIIITINFVKTLFSVTRPVQCFLHNFILMNKSLCVNYVLSITTIDMYFEKHYILWYNLLSSKRVCQALSITFSNGIVMYNITAALRDHIAYMAVSRMLFNEIDMYSNVKKFLLMSYLLVVAGFGIFPIQLTANQLCTSPLGVSIYDDKWAVIGPILLCSIILLSLTYSIFTYCAIYRTTYSSGKHVQTMASPAKDHQQPQLSKLLKNLSLSTVFRSLECLPILCTAFANLCCIYVSLDIQLMSILISIMCGSFISDIKLVWYPMFTKN